MCLIFGSVFKSKIISLVLNQVKLCIFYWQTGQSKNWIGQFEFDFQVNWHGKKSADRLFAGAPGNWAWYVHYRKSFVVTYWFIRRWNKLFRLLTDGDKLLFFRANGNFEMWVPHLVSTQLSTFFQFAFTLLTKTKLDSSLWMTSTRWSTWSTTSRVVAP